MPKKKVAEQQKSNSQIEGCFASHHFVQVSEPSITAGQLGAFGSIPRAPRNPRLYCTQCGHTIELSN